MAEFRQKFGAKVKVVRKQKKWTQEYLAEILNLDARSLRKIELGESFPSINTLEKMLEVFEMSTVDLFDFDHLQPQEDLKMLIIKMIDSNPDKITEIYKVVIKYAIIII